MRVFRIAVPASDIARSRGFYEELIGTQADDTVPSRIYFHCGDVIVAVTQISTWKPPPAKAPAGTTANRTTSTPPCYGTSIPRGPSLIHNSCPPERDASSRPRA